MQLQVDLQSLYRLCTPLRLLLCDLHPEIVGDRLDLIEACEQDHVVTSTLKLRQDSFQRISKAIPSLAETLISKLKAATEDI